MQKQKKTGNIFLRFDHKITKKNFRITNNHTYKVKSSDPKI